VPHPAKWVLAASRLIFVFTILAVAAMLVSAAIGYDMARQNDERLAAEQHSALRNAIAEFRSPLGRSDKIEPRLVRIAEQIAGVKHLKFESDPPANDREMRPVMDADGSIVGFFTWDKTRPMVRVMGRLASFFAVVAVVLFGFAALSLWQLKRARRELAVREIQAARAADEDKLTGLPNHAKTLELLDLALAERADRDWTTFALIELDGMEDVTAHHGVLGSDELIVAVAKRLKAALPSHAVCGRIANDTFAVTLTIGPEVDVDAIIRVALESISRPHWIDNVVRVGAHAGLAQAPRHAATRGELTRRTNLALRAAAKKRGPAPSLCLISR
jgi:diguanylate cyclase (GGDEF)-like protein